jgi:hypothetical protein
MPCDNLMPMDLTEREARAARRRQSIVLNRTRLKRAESDLTPLSGLAAIALVQQLTRETWAIARKPIPTYSRKEIPVRFVPGRLT